MTEPFINPARFHKPDPFEVFMARVAGQKKEFNVEGHHLVAYNYKGVTYITEFYKLT